ncbi:hypothetical protein PTKIN_Ptkin15bG0171100 [Pterospermum kingtungense]
MERSISLVFISILLFLVLFSDHVHGSQIEQTIRFKLIHRHASELGDQRDGRTLGSPSDLRERFEQLKHSDIARLHTVSQRLGHARMTLDLKKIEVPMRSAADVGLGQYFVSIKVGTPPVEYSLITDTGSLLTWIKCNYKCTQDCYKGNPEERIFNPTKSTSFKPIPCTDDFCNNHQLSSSAYTCNQPTSTCAYEYTYSDGTKVTGLYGNETITVGQDVTMTDVLIGCSEQITGKLNIHKMDGIMGLGLHDFSFPVKATRTLGHNKFSYCLVDHLSPSNVFNFLQFGEVAPPPNMQQTELLSGPGNPFYAVKVSGISVDGKMLDIPLDAWDKEKGGGFITDSGSTFSYLVKPAFDKVIEAFQAAFSKLQKVDVVGQEYCFSSTTGYDEKLMPKLAFHFADGAKFDPPVKNYIMKGGEGFVCFGIAPVDMPGISIIGNIMQQNYLWEFDLDHHKMGFAPSTCVIN